MFSAFIHETEAMLADMALVDIFFGVVGLIVGLVIAFLLSTLTASIPFSWVRLIVNIALYAVSYTHLYWTIMIRNCSSTVGQANRQMMRVGCMLSSSTSTVRPKPILKASFPRCFCSSPPSGYHLKRALSQPLRMSRTGRGALRRNRENIATYRIITETEDCVKKKGCLLYTSRCV